MPTAMIPREAIARQGLVVYFNRLGYRAGSLHPVWDSVRRIIWDAETALFRDEGASGNFPRWAPLSPKYDRWKRAHFGRRKILNLTGKLRRQLTGQQAPWHEERAARHFELGTDYPVAEGDLGGVHAWGRMQPPMPARPPIRISYVANDVIVNRIVQYIVNDENEWESAAGRPRRSRTPRTRF